MDNSNLAILINWTSPFLINGVSGVRFHYAPNFEEVEGAKKLRGHIGVGLSVVPCALRFAYGQKRLDIGS